MATRVYYNEFDPYCAQWLRNLIDAGRIPPGDVDDRSITEVQAHEIKGYDQWHFFAGLGGWGYAARLAGIGEKRGVLTGSPPCQPFSSAGKREGYADERHLAPVWLELVAALRPAWVFGEQVAAAIKKDDWLDDLLDALEAEGYATGAAVLPACGVGAAHIRQRLWVVARLEDTNSAVTQQPARQGSMPAQTDGAGSCSEPDGRGEPSRLGHSEQPGLEGHRRDGDRGQGWEKPARSVAETGEPDWVAGAYIERLHRERLLLREAQAGRIPIKVLEGSWSGEFNGLADACDAERDRRGEAGAGCSGLQHVADHRKASQRPGQTETGWDDPDWLYCRDGKWRPVESGTFPLADGIPARVGRLRAYGNAIVPQAAAEVMIAAMEPRDGE